MKLLFYFGHPAQFLFLREAIKNLISNGIEVKLLIKSKDVLENLLQSDGFEFENILPQERGNSKFAILVSLIKRIFLLILIAAKFKPQLMVSTDASIAIVGKLFGINRISITEDDYEVIKKLGDLTYPYTQTILCPTVCNVGKWNSKKVGYSGYMKLAYLHPNVFKPDTTIKLKYNLPENYAIIRLARLTAHHDFGIKGISNDFLDRLIFTLTNKGINILISSEAELQEKYKKYQLIIDPSEIHHILYYSKILICDSQSMSVEAAMLGVPSIRFSSFAGRISVLEELENKYHLTFGVKPEEPDKLFQILDNILSNDNFSDEFKERRTNMLNDKIDVSSFLTWFITKYPESVSTMKENPDYQYRFK